MQKSDKKFLDSLVKIPLSGRSKIPQTPGVYLFFKKNYPIYIGKAVNLKRRVGSYFDLDLERKTAKMVRGAEYVSYIQVESELEALLLEARLIRKFMPRYNVISKDDKHPLYIVITKEKFPRILSVRKLQTTSYQLQASYGPFPSSTAVKNVLRMVRRIFSYSDHKIGKRKCLYAHIGLCDPCPNEVIKQKAIGEKRKEEIRYLKNIRQIKAILSGKMKYVREGLEREMKRYSEQEMYEEANEIKRKLQNLDYITRPQIPTDSFLQNPNLYEDTRQKELRDLKKILKKASISISTLNHKIHIECYDIAHLSGKNPTASMVTFIDGEAEKSFYRHFKIKKAKGGDDYESMREVARRRIKHLDNPTSPRLRGVNWGRPDLIIVDGGVGQVKAFGAILHDNVVKIPVVGIAKNPDRLIAGDQKIKLQGLALNLVSRMRDEAHRFARRLHHKLLSKSLFGGTK